MDIPLGFNHLSMDRHVGFFHFLDRMNYAAMNMYKFLCGHILSFFFERESMSAMVERLRERVKKNLYFYFENLCYLFYKLIYITFIVYQLMNI